MLGGDIDNRALKDSFAKIKGDFLKDRADIDGLSETILSIQKQMESMYSEILALKKQNLELEHMIQLSKNAPRTIPDDDLIEKIVLAAIKKSQSEKKTSCFDQSILRKINRNKKALIKSRIIEMAKDRSRSLPDIKEIIVDQERLCSKATFYRYIERLKEKGLIGLVEIEETSILVNL